MEILLCVFTPYYIDLLNVMIWCAPERLLTFRGALYGKRGVLCGSTYALHIVSYISNLDSLLSFLEVVVDVRLALLELLLCIAKLPCQGQ